MFLAYNYFAQCTYVVHSVYCLFIVSSYFCCLGKRDFIYVDRVSIVFISVAIVKHAYIDNIDRVSIVFSSGARENIIYVQLLYMVRVSLYSILYSGKCSFRYQTTLQIIHQSLAIENSFMRSLVRGTKQLSVYVGLDRD